MNRRLKRIPIADVPTGSIFVTTQNLDSDKEELFLVLSNVAVDYMEGRRLMLLHDGRLLRWTFGLPGTIECILPQE